MIQIRKSVFETNSSSSHSVVISLGSGGLDYSLRDGYLEVERVDLYLEGEKMILSTLEEKLGFILTWILALIEGEKCREKGSEYVIKPKELYENQDFQKIDKILKENIFGYKGINFNFIQNNDDGVYGGDSKHFSNCKNIIDYCYQMGLTLDELLLNPNISIVMNPDCNCMWG